jgi:pSer/pThr/pTyr-binding forkhead associated (FHA) protein
MEVKLIVLGGQKSGQEVPVVGDRFVIGRGEECQLRPGSPMVSRRHCVILLEEGRVAVEDLGSKNGTFVNGEEISGQRELKAGDKLSVGPLEFEVRVAVPIGGKKKPKVRSVQEAAARTVQAAAGEDVDIAQWLDDEDDEQETVTTGRGTIDSATHRGDETVRQQPAADAPRSTQKKPASSRDAAEEALNQVFGKKR